MDTKYKGYMQNLAGAQYEQYIAKYLRQDGWAVEEIGRNGIWDHGIDLIARKDGIQRYIQCKGWNRRKFIHEDVVDQLYGSVAAFVGRDEVDSVEKYIYSPARLDDYAQGVAGRLGIKFERVRFPRRPYHPGYYFRSRRSELDRRV